MGLPPPTRWMRTLNGPASTVLRFDVLEFVFLLWICASAVCSSAALVLINSH